MSLGPGHPLRAKYGGNPRDAINRAIRAELVGGDAVLDALGLVHHAHRKLLDRDLPGIAQAAIAADALQELRDLMVEEIARRYDLADEDVEQAYASRRRR